MAKKEESRETKSLAVTVKAIEAKLAEELAGLEEKYPYHNWQHILVVEEGVRELAEKTGIEPREIFLMRIAAFYHDAGYKEGPKNHEERSAWIAGEDLKKFGLEDKDIFFVKSLILATRGYFNEQGAWVTEPEVLPEQILCDADLSHLGLDNFANTSEALRQELEEPPASWRQKQINLLAHHQWHTQAAFDLWDQRRQENLRELMESG